MGTGDADLEDILKVLSKNEKFDKLQDSVGVHGLSNYCNKIESSNNNCTKAKSVCEEIIKKLKAFEKDDYIQSNHDDFCSYFTHWTYDKIRETFTTECSKNFEECYNCSLNNIVINAYNKIIRKSCIFYFVGNFDDWKEEKYLYYYFKKRDHFKSKKNSASEEKQKYVKFLEYIKTIYEKHINKCCIFYLKEKNHNNVCPKYFNCEENNNPNDLLNELKYRNAIPSAYWEQLIKDLTIDRDVIMKSEDLLNYLRTKLLEDPFYKAITFGFVVVGVLFTVFLFYKITYGRKNKNKDNFLDPDGNLGRFYQEKHRKTNWDDNKIRLSYYAV
ncbi:PIR Superfamily Protein [Plasmodium malariae]|uniref:PIR Superfamily Protein n=1 Tax=Plasmodium malariae TaxID=5858 RepID=A0A1A8XAF3_PLAMA|nr:PIR Superfamily Protein [Plasmodium malariae]